jgi:hypothetical protein
MMYVPRLKIHPLPPRTKQKHFIKVLRGLRVCLSDRVFASTCEALGSIPLQKGLLRDTCICPCPWQVPQYWVVEMGRRWQNFILNLVIYRVSV